MCVCVCVCVCVLQKDVKKMKNSCYHLGRDEKGQDETKLEGLWQDRTGHEKVCQLFVF